MKGLVLVLCVTASAAHAQATSTGLVFRNLTPGSALSAGQLITLGCGGPDEDGATVCLADKTTIGSVVLTPRILVRDGRLVQASYDFATRDFDLLAEVLTQLWGAPSKRTPSTTTTRAGVTYDNLTLNWSRGGHSAQITRYADDINTGRMSHSDEALLVAWADARRQREVGAAVAAAAGSARAKPSFRFQGVGFGDSISIGLTVTWKCGPSRSVRGEDCTRVMQHRGIPVEHTLSFVDGRMCAFTLSYATLTDASIDDLLRQRWGAPASTKQSPTNAASVWEFLEGELIFLRFQENPGSYASGGIVLPVCEAAKR